MIRVARRGIVFDFAIVFCLCPQALFTLLIEQSIDVESSFLEGNERSREDTVGQSRRQVLRDER